MDILGEEMPTHGLKRVGKRMSVVTIRRFIDFQRNLMICLILFMKNIIIVILRLWKVFLIMENGVDNNYKFDGNLTAIAAVRFYPLKKTGWETCL